jgi:hypothetical protein
VRVTLWAERARAFKLENVYDPLEQKPIVTLFVGCLAKKFQGKYKSDQHRFLLIFFISTTA